MVLGKFTAYIIHIIALSCMKSAQKIPMDGGVVYNPEWGKNTEQKPMNNSSTHEWCYGH